MFTQSAYKDPSVMVNQLKSYLVSVGSNNGWQESYTNGLLSLVDDAYEDNYSIFRFNETIIELMLVQFQDEFEQYTIMYTMNNPDTIPKYAKVYNVISELIGTTDFIEKTESVTNIVEEQIIEGAKDIQKKSDDTFERFVPYIGLGVVAYFVLPRVIREFQR